MCGWTTNSTKLSQAGNRLLQPLHKSRVVIKGEDMSIRYSSQQMITSGEFIDLLKRSTLAERRPVHDLPSIESMLKHANLICSAWDGDLLVGIARSITDFSFCCYLSDLAVDKTYQKKGIGRKLISLTQSRIGPAAKVILLAAPAAVEYYPHIGLSQHPSAWIIAADKPLT